MTVKTIIMVWTTKICNLVTDDTDNFWGLGDMIRGTVQMYQLSKKRNIQFIVDIQLHPLSKCLKKRDHPFSDFIYKNKDNIKFIQNVNQALSTHDDEIFYCFTNDYYHNSITPDCREFIKDILTPNDTFKQYMDKYTLPYHSYDILHFRLGDNEMVRNNINTDLNKYLMYVDKLKNDQTILLSDSYTLKQCIKTNFPRLFMFDTQIGHIGYHQDDQSIKDTFFEFCVMTKSNKITTHTVYPWLSGFIVICKDIYNIPVVCI
jgi:hypothetical protein